MLIDITTKSGFSCKIDDCIFDDMEMLEAIRDTMSEDEIKVLSATVDLAELVFGEQKKDLYAHIKAQHGRVPVEIISGDIVSVMNSIGKAKNWLPLPPALEGIATL